MNEILEALESHKLWVETVGKRGKQLGLDELDLRDICVTNYPLEQGYITECNFDGMDLKNVDFYRSWLCGSSFKSANLNHANFTRANLEYVDFSNAIIQNARFAKNDYVDARFYQADLTNTVLFNCFFHTTDFRGAILKHVDITLSYFKGALLQGTKLIGLKGIEEAYIRSINIGTPENPIILEKEEARQWFLDNNVIE